MIQSSRYMFSSTANHMGWSTDMHKVKVTLKNEGQGQIIEF